MKKIWMMAACAATFYACSSSDINTPEIQETGTLQVSTSVLTQNSKGTKNTPSTKADTFHSGPVMGTALAQGSQIGVFVFKNGTKIEYSGAENTIPALNQNWNLGAGGWTGANFTLGIQPADVYAYFPYIHSVSPLSDNTIQPAYDAIPVAPGYTDYLYGKSSKTVNSTSSNATIQLNHALAMISFTFRKSSTYPATEEAKIQAITIKNLPANGIMNIATETNNNPVSNITGTNDLAVKQWVNNSYVSFGKVINYTGDELNLSLGYSDANTTPLFHALVLPNNDMPFKDQIDNENLHAIVTIDGVEYKIALAIGAKLDGTTNGDNSWKSGKHYIYNLKISGNSGQGNALEVTTVSVTQWTAGGSSDIEI